jgi:hypothetical protein
MLRDGHMAFEKEVSTAPRQLDKKSQAPRKVWETPRFDQHDVRTTTQAKPFNALEDSVFSGPMS